MRIPRAFIWVLLSGLGTVGTSIQDPPIGMPKAGNRLQQVKRLHPLVNLVMCSRDLARLRQLSHCTVTAL